VEVWKCKVNTGCSFQLAHAETLNIAWQSNFHAGKGGAFRRARRMAAATAVCTRFWPLPAAALREFSESDCRLQEHRFSIGACLEWMIK
jgi:hypothetical protein